MDRRECVYMCKTTLPLSEWVRVPGPNGGTNIACLHVSDLQRHDIVDDDMYCVYSPTNRFLRMIFDGSEVDQTNHPDGKEDLKVFFLYGKNAGRLGIRTSQNWNVTYWGLQCVSLPGFWILPAAHLPERVLDFKLVSQGADGTIQWEPNAFTNKKVYIYDRTQFILAEWGSMDAHVYMGYKQQYPDYRKLQGSLIKIGCDIFRVPFPEKRFVRIPGKKMAFTKMQCPNIKETIKLFFLYGKDAKLGIRTSQDWSVTHWGVKHPSFPDYWTVTLSHLSEGNLDFKVVSQTESRFEWESSNNKVVSISSAAQIISAEWGAEKASVFDLPLYRKDSHILVTKPKARENDLNMTIKPGKFSKFIDQVEVHPKSWEEHDPSLFPYCMDYPIIGQVEPVSFPYQTSAYITKAVDFYAWMEKLNHIDSINHSLQNYRDDMATKERKTKNHPKKERENESRNPENSIVESMKNCHILYTG